MASFEGAFDFPAVLQKDHGGKERYDRQGAFGSAIAARSAKLWEKNDTFNRLWLSETLSDPARVSGGLDLAGDSREVGADTHGTGRDGTARIHRNTIT